MENNFIQMAASAGHAVAYTIGPIFKHINIYSIVTFIFDSTPQIIDQRCQIAVPRRSNGISSAADNAIFKNRAQNIECSSSWVARIAIQLKPNVANILIFAFCEQKQRSLLTVMASPCSFSKKNGPVMPLDQNLHQTVIRFGCVGFSMYVCGYSVPKMRKFCLLHTRQDQNELHLKIWFFLPNSASSVSRSQAHLCKRINNHIRSVEG